jgi:hypothetical protein
MTTKLDEDEIELEQTQIDAIENKRKGILAQFSIFSPKPGAQDLVKIEVVIPITIGPGVTPDQYVSSNVITISPYYASDDISVLADDMTVPMRVQLFEKGSTTALYTMPESKPVEAVTKPVVVENGEKLQTDTTTPLEENNDNQDVDFGVSSAYDDPISKAANGETGKKKAPSKLNQAHPIPSSYDDKTPTEVIVKENVVPPLNLDNLNKAIVENPVHPGALNEITPRPNQFNYDTPVTHKFDIPPTKKKTVKRLTPAKQPLAQNNIPQPKEAWTGQEVETPVNNATDDNDKQPINGDASEGENSDDDADIPDEIIINGGATDDPTIPDIVAEIITQLKTVHKGDTPFNGNVVVTFVDTENMKTQTATAYKAFAGSYKDYVSTREKYLEHVLFDTNDYQLFKTFKQGTFSKPADPILILRFELFEREYRHILGMSDDVALSKPAGHSPTKYTAVELRKVYPLEPDDKSVSIHKYKYNKNTLNDYIIFVCMVLQVTDEKSLQSIFEGVVAKNVNVFDGYVDNFTAILTSYIDNFNTHWSSPKYYIDFAGNSKLNGNWYNFKTGVKNTNAKYTYTIEQSKKTDTTTYPNYKLIFGKQSESNNPDTYELHYGQINPKISEKIKEIIRIDLQTLLFGGATRTNVTLLFNPDENPYIFSNNSTRAPYQFYLP